MKSRTITSFILLAAVAVPASAADFDIRLTAGAGAELSEAKSSAGTTTLGEDGGLGGSLTAHVFLGEGLVGFMAGGGFKVGVHAADEPNGSGGTDNYTYTGMGVLLEAGLTIKPTPIWRVELRPQVTIGQGEVEIDVTGTNTVGDKGDYLAYGIVVGNYLRFDWFEIGIDLGYESFSGKSDIAGTEVEGTGDGFIAQLGLGIIF